MGRHSQPDEYDTLKMSQAYSQGPRFKPDNYEFDTWWEDYVTAPVEAANNLDLPTKIIPLTSNMPQPEQSDTEVDVWKVFAYLIMITLSVVVVLYVVAAALAVALIALLLASAWVAKK